MARSATSTTCGFSTSTAWIVRSRFLSGATRRSASISRGRPTTASRFPPTKRCFSVSMWRPRRVRIPHGPKAPSSGSGSRMPSAANASGPTQSSMGEINERQTADRTHRVPRGRIGFRNHHRGQSNAGLQCGGDVPGTRGQEFLRGQPEFRSQASCAGRPWLGGDGYCRRRVLRLSFLGADGPVAPELVQATLGRATHVEADRTPDFVWTGTAYEAPVELTPGNWNLRLVAAAEDGTRFERRFPIFIRPGA